MAYNIMDKFWVNSNTIVNKMMCFAVCRHPLTGELNSVSSTHSGQHYMYNAH